MIDNTINDDRTVAGGGKDMILAGRYHIPMKFASWAFAFDAIMVSFTARQPPCLVCFCKSVFYRKRRAVAALFPAFFAHRPARP